MSDSSGVSATLCSSCEMVECLDGQPLTTAWEGLKVYNPRRVQSVNVILVRKYLKSGYRQTKEEMKSVNKRKGNKNGFLNNDLTMEHSSNMTIVYLF